MQYKGYKYRIYPTKEQEILIAKTFGCCRFVYNKALSLKMSLYSKEKKGISVFNLMKEMVKWKDLEETKWLKEVNSQSLQQSLVNLDCAYTRFFKEKKGFPKFKAKSDNRQSFGNTQHTVVDWDTNKVYIPKFKEGIKCILHRKFEGKIKTSTVSKAPSGKYFISVLVETNTENPKCKKPKENKTLGIDLGIKDFATFSDGTVIENPKHLNKRQKQLKRQQRKLSSKKKGSNNRNKQRIKVAKLYEKVTNCRKDFLHKLTYNIVKNQDYSSVAIEDLNVKDMIEKSQKNVSRAMSDVGWGCFRTFLTYKCEREGKNLLVIGRFDPSSKLCLCGYLNDKLTLKDRGWECPKCKAKHNRDVLAAQNIKRFAFCKQNTAKDKILIGRESPEFTLLESDVSCSLKKESFALVGK